MFLTLTESLLSYERKYLVQAGWPCTLYKASKDQTSVNVLKTFSLNRANKRPFKSIYSYIEPMS